MPDWAIEPLHRLHERGEFSCGRPLLDNFLRVLVRQYEKRHLGRTYVAVRPGEKRVLGYYTIASGSVSFESLPAGRARKLPRHPVPVVLLARLAVDQCMQGQGLGVALLVDALARCRMLADSLGIHAVQVDAIDASARSFYEKYGFTPLPESPNRLLLPIATIRRASGEA